VVPAAGAEGDVASPSTCTSHSHLFYYVFLTFAFEAIRNSYLTAHSSANPSYTEDKRKKAIPVQSGGKYILTKQAIWRNITMRRLPATIVAVEKQ
jgi:hypothetical protein